MYYRRVTSQNSDNDGKKNDESVDLFRDYFPLDVNCLSKKPSKFGIDEKIKKLIRLYDLQNFVVFVPTADSTNVISTESWVKFLMSSFCLSAFNTRWLELSNVRFDRAVFSLARSPNQIYDFSFIPIFAQVYQSWQNCFIGVRIDDDGLRVDYQMMHLGKVPSKLHHFSGNFF